MYRKFWNAMIAGLVGPCLSLVLTGCQPEADPVPDSDRPGGSVLIHNARIYTGDAGFTLIEKGAMAISEEGEIVALGNSEPMIRTFPGARQVDLEGQIGAARLD